jgi:Leucine-rich repeat (LRR) protein
LKHFKLSPILLSFLFLINCFTLSISQFSAYAQGTTQETISFKDINLEKAVREALNKPAGFIFKSDVETLTTFSAVERQIINLDGLQYFKNLNLLNLRDNNIKDLSPIGSLTRLTILFIENNAVEDITPIGNLINLKHLFANNNEIRNLQPLENCKGLIDLVLQHNNIADISPISQLTQLDFLNLGFNQISDVSPLSSLNKLKTLLLEDNYISDIQPLSTLVNVENLNLNHNRFTTIKSLSPLKNLREFVAWSVRSSNINDSRFDLVINEAVNIISKHIKPEMSEFEKILTLHDYVVRNTYNSEDSENFFNAYGTLVEGQGVCSGYTEGLLLLLDLIGIKSYYVQGLAGGFAHAWNVVRIGDQYYNIDSLWNDHYNNYNYFLVSNDELVKQDPSRTFSEATYRKCTSERYSTIREILNSHNDISSRQNFHIKGQYVYYSNTRDSNKLYKANVDGTQITKLSDDSAKKIKSDGSWVYYTNSSFMDKLYKVRIDGTGRIEQTDVLRALATDKGYLSPRFEPNTFEYNLELQHGTTLPPIISAVSSSSDNSVEIISTTSYPGTSVINITDKTGKIINSYRVNVSIASTNNPGLNRAVFADKNLELLVRKAADIPADAALHRKDVENIRELNAIAALATGNISGIENLVNLKSLNLTFNNINDISPLSQLKNLTSLRISANRISDLTPLSGLTKLTISELNSNLIKDISPLRNLIRLKRVELDENQISDLSPIANLTNLELFYARYNQIAAVPDLNKLTNLRVLYLSGNQIQDINNICDASSLMYLNLSDNRIKNISNLHKLTGLAGLSLANNAVTDISSLQMIDNLSWLELGGNQIEDFSAVYKYYKRLRSKDFLIGDFNRDNEISILDLAALSKVYGAQKGKSNLFQNKYDFNLDGIVDLYDLVTLSNYISN